MINRDGANVSPCKTPAAKKPNVALCEQTIALLSIIIVVTVSFRRPYAGSICSIFPLCIKSNALEKSTNKSVALRFFCIYYIDVLTNSQILRSCRLISPKYVLTFPKNFLNFNLETVCLCSS